MVHTKRTTTAMRSRRDAKDTKWYPIHSKTTQIAVEIPRKLRDRCFFLHRRTSAAVHLRKKNNENKLKDDALFISQNLSNPSQNVKS